MRKRFLVRGDAIAGKSCQLLGRKDVACPLGRATIDRRTDNLPAKDGLSRTSLGVCKDVGFHAIRLSFVLAAVSGCSHRSAAPDVSQPSARPLVLVVAPALNLSNSSLVDTVKLSDVVASELLSFESIAVIPVNLARAALAARGRTHVRSPDEARELAAEFGADATLVAAITEFEPYEPPRVGLVLQWYEAAGNRASPSDFDPVRASRSPGELTATSLSGGDAPRLQVQRVYDAASETVDAELRQYWKQRDGQTSPYGWRKTVVSQELFIRYCCWSGIRSMLSQHPTRERGLDAGTDAE